MIFDFNHLQWQPMDRWPIAYRYTQQRWNKLDPRTLATIRPLAEVSALQLAAVHDLDGLVMQARSSLLSECWEIMAIDDGDPISTKSWLRRQRPSAEDDVYVEWAVAGSCAAVVAWYTLGNDPTRSFADFGSFGSER